MSKANPSHMRRAVELSRTHMKAGKGGPFGALIVRGGEIISEGHNKVTSANDPTAHAEVVAIREACRKLGDFSLAGCEIYTSCEPCPMCLAAIYWARLEAIYFANDRSAAARIGFDDDHIYREIGLDPGERSIPVIQMACSEAAAVFDEWANMPDKVAY